MDIERFKRLSIPKIEAGKMTKVVRDVIKEVRTNKQNVYEKTSENLLPLTDKIDLKLMKRSKLNLISMHSLVKMSWITYN